MTLSNETITFFKFVLLGAIFSFLFDIFRGLRRVKKTKEIVVCIQDIIYFLIIGIILTISIVKYLDTEIRLYLFFAIVLGITIYVSIVGNIVRNIFAKIFMVEDKILEFIFLPISLYKTVFEKQINILKKFVVKYCKKISHMINFNRVKTKFVVLKKKLKTKEDFKNDKKRKSSCKKTIN